jgi:hypothetical protein
MHRSKQYNLFDDLVGAERRSDADGSILTNPSRSSGRMLSPSVVRSITMSSASALIVSGRSRLSFARIENWVVRRPLGAIYNSLLPLQELQIGGTRQICLADAKDALPRR